MKISDFLKKSLNNYSREDTGSSQYGFYIEKNKGNKPDKCEYSIYNEKDYYKYQYNHYNQYIIPISYSERVVFVEYINILKYIFNADLNITVDDFKNWDNIYDNIKIVYSKINKAANKYVSIPPSFDRENSSHKIYVIECLLKLYEKHKILKELPFPDINEFIEKCANAKSAKLLSEKIIRDIKINKLKYENCS